MIVSFNLSFILTVFVIITITSSEDAGKSITLFHQLLDGETFVYRGIINVKNTPGYTYEVSQDPVSHQAADALLTLAENGGLYRTKYIVKYGEGDEAEFFSFIKAERLLASNLMDELDILVGVDEKIIAINHAVSSSTNSTNTVRKNSQEFVTEVKFIQHSKGPVPDFSSLQKEAKMKGTLNDNRSFLGKYWMYLIPVFLLLVLSSAQNQESAEE